MAAKKFQEVKRKKEKKNGWTSSRELFLFILEDMNTAMHTAGMGVNWIILLAFVILVLLVACIVCIFLLRDNHRKQRLYGRFGENLSEFVVVLSQRLEFLYGLPKYMSDPLFDKLSSGFGFQDLQDPKDWARMRLFFDDVDKHQDMSFIFSIVQAESEGIMENDRVQWYEMRTMVERVSLQERNYVCFIKNISKENENRKTRFRLQTQLDSLLQNTGDFLWCFEVEERRFRLLTPLLDEEHRVMPQLSGYVDIHELMPDSDIEMLNAVLNERVKDFRNFGSRGDPFESVKVRLYGPEKTLVWYSMRGRLLTDEDNRLVFQGTARRMDMVLDNPVVGKGGDGESMLAAALAFPDVRVFWVDSDFVIQGCNQSFATDFQIINPKEIYGKTLDAVVSLQFLPYMTKVVRDVFDSNRSVSWRGLFGQSRRLLMMNSVPIKSRENSSRIVMCVYFLLDKGDFTDEV